MGLPALSLVDAAVAEEAAAAAVELTVIEGGAGLAAETGGAVLAGEAAAGSAAAAGIGGAAVATAGVALVVIGLAALGYYLYTQSEENSDEPAVPRQPKAVAPCPTTVASAGASSEPVMPAGLSTADQELWEECKAAHEEYKRTDAEAAAQSAAIKPLLDDLANSRPMTPQQKLDLCNMVKELINTLKELHRQRQGYVESECDKFDWFNEGETQQQRESAHRGAMAGVDKQIKNLYAAMRRYCKS
jgi:hypothetical protein